MELRLTAHDPGVRVIALRDLVPRTRLVAARRVRHQRATGGDSGPEVSTALSTPKPRDARDARVA